MRFLNSLILFIAFNAQAEVDFYSQKFHLKNRPDEQVTQLSYWDKLNQIELMIKSEESQRDTFLNYVRTLTFQDKHFFIGLGGSPDHSQYDILPKLRTQLGFVSPVTATLYQTFIYHLRIYTHSYSHQINESVFVEKNNYFSQASLYLDLTRDKRNSSSLFNSALMLKTGYQITDETRLWVAGSYGTEANYNVSNNTLERIKTSSVSMGVNQQISEHFKIRIDSSYEKSTRINRKGHTIGLGVTWTP